uniref:hypothetical protein n=1 Tax=Ningiella ruwaisensis TaxID=2364274 RepID=UPI00109F7A6D|nr:hypothetical protein [Ningiella ruwaisensis]
MKLASIAKTLVALTVLVSSSLFAQINETENLFGDGDQPGKRLHSIIVQNYTAGDDPATAINKAIEFSLEEDATILGGEGKSVVAFDMPHASQFFVHMTEHNSLIETMKRLVEGSPEKAVHSITLGVVLYPNHAQEIYDGAALAGVLAPDDITVAMLQAGADPTQFSDATAAGATAGGPVTATVTPIGAGIGAGGTGGGDTTASTN